jgi:hypothetical protein
MYMGIWVIRLLEIQSDFLSVLFSFLYALKFIGFD